MNSGDGAPAIRVAGLYKDFGDYPVLRGLDLTVGWGEFLVIFGANGSGKTTLLKLLSTQARPDKGEIWVGGISRNRNPVAIRRIIGVVGHQPMLYKEMTCQENLLFFGRMYGVNELSQRIDVVLRKVGLERRRHQRVHTLSHGMQKRLAIGRAILHDPPILLLDEPEAGLDQEALENMGQVLNLWKGGKRTVIMATHNVELGLVWGDEVAVLADGRIVYKEDRQSLDVPRFRGAYLRQIEVAV